MSLISRRTLNTRMRPMLHNAFAMTGLLAALLAVPVFADEATDVNKLVRAGQHTEAIAKVDAFLAQHPRDAQMRFLKGVILAEQNKSAEAIAVFIKLTEDFPDLPEPYNNLAVLYASSGQYDKARTALDMAIRTNPTYAVAYENLGDVHAKLASQAYDKALQLDSANSGAKSKLTLIRTLVGNITGGTNPKIATAAVGTIAPTRPAAEISQMTAKSPALTTAHTSAVAAVKQETPKAAAKSVSNSDSEQDDVLNTIHGWVKAWSAQDVKSYLNFYASDFQTPHGETRKAWAEERRDRIAGKGRISVKIESPHVTMNGNTATVKFRQIYASDRLTANSRKVLVLAKQGGKWQIKQERSGS